jgi:hypothetical protein
LTSLSNVSGGTKANNRIFNIVDNVDWQRGAHSIKLGGGVEHYHNFYGIVPNYGTFTFDGSITGSPYADFLLGLPQSDQRVNPLGNRSQDLTEYNLYIDDTYKVTRKLTAYLGVRWD